MWNRAKERRFLTHRLCSRIVDDEPQGYAALDWESILHGHAADLGEYKELAVLPDKIARYCMNFMLHLMPPMDFLFYQWTEAVLMCMGSSGLIRYTDFFIF